MRIKSNRAVFITREDCDHCMRHTGVTARGVICPIFREGDNLSNIICDTMLKASEAEGFIIEDGDILAITESIVARTQGNYATCEQISKDIQNKFGGETIGLVFPILSRNRFSVLLKAIAASCKKLYIQLSYPSDEVGNALISWEQLDNAGVNPYTNHFNEAEFRAKFGDDIIHPFTGVNYIDFYKSFGEHIEIVFSNDPAHILKYTDNVLCCDVHTRERTRRILTTAGAKKVYTLANIMTESIDGSGYNPIYGVLGSNMATEDSVKLFPRDSQPIVDDIQRKMKETTQKDVEVLIYGDGCFKDPVGGIWEFDDPVVSPAFTSRLAGTPNEIKIKFFADNELSGLSGEELNKAMRDCILKKDNDLVGSMAAQGTTPRRYVDLVGSLCDLVSGSGDRGTPLVYIKGYFTNYAASL